MSAVHKVPRAAGPKRRCAGCDGGYTLLELMIAMSIGLLVTCAVLSLYRDQRDAFERAADWASIAEAGHAALDLISVQARLAGLSVEADDMGTQPPGPQHMSWPQSTQSMAPRPAPQFFMPLAERLPVFGCHAGRPAGPADAPQCEADSRASDGVQFLSAGNNISSWPDIDGAATDCLGQALAAHSVSAARFFTRLSSASGEPELYCDGGGRLGNAQPVAEGVETMLLTYWLDGTAAPQSVVSADQWPQVRALEICLVVRGQPGHVRLPYMDCNGRSVPGSDRRRRQVFRLFIALRNHPVST